MKQVFFFILLLPAMIAAQNRDSINRLVAESLKHELEYTDNKQKELELNASLGILYNQAGKYDSARIYLNRAISLPGGREWEGGRLITNLANSYGFEGQYAEALKYYMEALRVSEQLATTQKQAHSGACNVFRTMANLAEIYFLMGNHEQALYYAERGKELFYKELIKTAPAIGYIVPQILYVIGSVHLDRNELDKAEKAMRETYEVADSIAESLYKKVNDPCGMYMYAAYGKEGLAQVSLARKDYVHALDYAAEALEYAKKNGDPTVTAKILTTFSDIYLAQDNYKESGRFAQEAMKLYPAYPEVNPDVSFNAAAARLFSGDKEEAYRYFRLYADRIKANTGKQFRETMASMEVQFETEKKELHITNLEQQRILYIFIGIACFVSAILIWIFLRQKIKNEQRDKKLIATNAILEWEKEVRKRFAHDLHEGINGRLSALKFQLGTAEHLRNICDQLDECIETIRRMSIGMMPGSLERYGLKASLEDYCRLFPNVDFHFLGENRRIDGKLELTVYYCAYELVNNAFRHSGASEINVGLIIKDNYVSLTVEDNGCGFDEQGAAKGSGLKSIRDRVTTVNGKIDIDTAPGEGTEISIELKENI